MNKGGVVVVGSLNCDLVMRVPRFPTRGETVLGTSFHTFVGGKGCNQAVAAARSGASVTMIGRVGADAFGELITRKLREEGIDVRHVLRDPDVGTGVADILVDDAGENMIAVAPLANGRLSPGDIDAARDALEGAAVVLMQLEIPIATAIHAAEIGRSKGALVVLNPAPAPATAIDALLARVDFVVPNQSEAESLTKTKVDDEATAEEAAARLRAFGVQSAIVTLGARGALYADEGCVALVDGFRVEPVDTTGAGDAFVGALAAALADGRSLAEAVLFGCASGALACTKLGAEPSLPRAADIGALVRSRG